MRTKNTTFPPRIALLIPKLATPHDGELVATRDAIERLLRGAGLDWHDVASACTPNKVEGVVTPSPSRAYASEAHSGHASFGDFARAARDLDRGRLTSNERAFVMQMCARGFSFTPTPRQADWLEAILYRLHGRAAA